MCRLPGPPQRGAEPPRYCRHRWLVRDVQTLLLRLDADPATALGGDWLDLLHITLPMAIRHRDAGQAAEDGALAAAYAQLLTELDVAGAERVTGA